MIPVAAKAAETDTFRSGPWDHHVACSAKKCVDDGCVLDVPGVGIEFGRVCLCKYRYTTSKVSSSGNHTVAPCQTSVEVLLSRNSNKGVEYVRSYHWLGSKKGSLASLVLSFSNP